MAKSKDKGPPKKPVKRKRGKRAASAPSKSKALVTTGPRGIYQITDRGLQLVRDLARVGHPMVSIAEHLGLNRDTFRALQKRDERVAEATALGVGEHETLIAERLTKAALEGNVTAMIFLAKARHGWVEGTERQGVVQANVQIVLPAAKSVDEWTPPTMPVVDAESEDEDE